MSEPKPNEHVWGLKTQTGGVTVHRPQFHGTRNELTTCNRQPIQWSWLWIEYRSLNPEFVRLCRRCWEEEQ